MIPKETPETAVASRPEEAASKTDAADDKEIILPSVIDDSELPTIEASVDEMPTDQTQCIRYNVMFFRHSFYSYSRLPRDP